MSRQYDGEVVDSRHFVDATGVYRGFWATDENTPAGAKHPQNVAIVTSPRIGYRLANPKKPEEKAMAPYAIVKNGRIVDGMGLVLCIQEISVFKEAQERKRADKKAKGTPGVGSRKGERIEDVSSEIPPQAMKPGGLGVVTTPV